MPKARAPVTAVLALLAGCSLAPAYNPPAMTAPATFKEAAGWAAAAPADAAPRGSWWTMFGDPVLDNLEARVEPASPTLAAAAARYEQALGEARVARAAELPSLDLSAEGSRNRLSAGRPLSPGTPARYNDFTIGASLAYELDLWGRVRNGARAARADAAASAADLASVRLSLQAQVADAYFRLRGLDAQIALLRETIGAFTRAHDLTVTRHEGGVASGIDVNRSQTLLSDARAQLSDSLNRRAAVEHEIAALVGEVASSFAVAPMVRPLDPRPVPAGAPSELLQRRPDIAEAERRVFAANARIGVAKAALFPQLTLGASAGYQTASGALLGASSGFWALGPLSAVLNVFDGGARRAQVRISRAQYDETAADYRATVLTAFREVEDGLAAARNLATQTTDQREAAAAAERTRDLALTRYRDGASDYLEVVTAQTEALDAERATLALLTLRLQTSVALVRALGGGYNVPNPAR